MENNQRSRGAMVVEPGIRLLYLEGTLRAEYGALVEHVLAKDPDLEFCALVQTHPNVFLKRSNMRGLKLAAIPADQESVDKFDVFILGDLDSSYLRPRQQEMLLKRVRQGAGLLMLGGYHSLGPGGYGQTPLGQALPAILGGKDIGQASDAFWPVLTPEGDRHPIFANIGEFFPTQAGDAKTAGLPALDGCTRVERARPGATVLATLSREPNSMPCWPCNRSTEAAQRSFAATPPAIGGKSRQAMGQDSPFLRFWGQMIRWLAGRAEEFSAAASIAASVDKVNYEPGEPIRISAIVRDKQGQGAADAKVTAKTPRPRRTARANRIDRRARARRALRRNIRAERGRRLRNRR